MADIEEPREGLPSSRRSKPSRTLPTERIAFQKQLDLARAWSVATEYGARPATNADVAKVTVMTAGTVSLGNGFFIENGFLIRQEGGYLPSAEVVAFAKAHAWDPAGAPHKLAPLLQRTWFGSLLTQRLEFSGSLTYEGAVHALAEAASAGPEWKAQLTTLVDYLVVGGIVAREGDQVRLARRDLYAREPHGAERSDDGGANDDAPRREVPRAVPTNQRPSQLASSPASGGGIAFNVSLSVEMSEMAGWPADRISAFFAGIAKVLAAKGALDAVDGSGEGAV